MISGRLLLSGLVVAGASVIAIACGGSDRAGFNSENAAAPAGGTTSGAPANPGGFGEQQDAGASGDGCSEEAKLVYVLSLEGDIHSFAPAQKKFTKIGALDCRSGNAKFTPISMAVARDATAWVNMREEGFLGGGESTLFKVDTKTAKCTPTPIKGNIGGMGFSTNEGTTDKETLYAIGTLSGTKGQLLKVDFAKEELAAVSDLKDQKADLELTGTGDGRLYGFLIDDPLALARVDKASTVYSDRVTLTNVERPMAPMFAFTFWGGDFYFYTATSQSANKSTNVTQYRPKDGNIDKAYMQNIGFHIVGAGVSTCAPTTQPK